MKRDLKIKGVSTQDKKREYYNLKKNIFSQNVLENYKTFFLNKGMFNEKKNAKQLLMTKKHFEHYE